MRPAAPFTRLADCPPHRAFVGQPQRFDLAGASQFALLFPLGLREHHRLLGPEGYGPSPETADWVYADCVVFMPDRPEALATEAGLVMRACPWPHPERHWFVLARDESALPPRERMNALKIAPSAWRT